MNVAPSPLAPLLVAVVLAACGEDQRVHSGPAAPRTSPVKHALSAPTESEPATAPLDVTPNAVPPAPHLGAMEPVVRFLRDGKPAAASRTFESRYHDLVDHPLAATIESLLPAFNGEVTLASPESRGQHDANGRVFSSSFRQSIAATLELDPTYAPIVEDLVEAVVVRQLRTRLDSGATLTPFGDWYMIGQGAVDQAAFEHMMPQMMGELLGQPTGDSPGPRRSFHAPGYAISKIAEGFQQGIVVEALPLPTEQRRNPMYWTDRQFTEAAAGYGYFSKVFLVGKGYDLGLTPLEQNCAVGDFIEVLVAATAELRRAAAAGGYANGEQPGEWPGVEAVALEYVDAQLPASAIVIEQSRACALGRTEMRKTHYVAAEAALRFLDQRPESGETCGEIYVLAVMRSPFFADDSVRMYDGVRPAVWRVMDDPRVVCREPFRKTVDLWLNHTGL